MWQHGLPVLGALVVMISVGQYAVSVEASSLCRCQACAASQSRMNEENVSRRERVVKRTRWMTRKVGRRSLDVMGCCQPTVRAVRNFFLSSRSSAAKIGDEKTHKKEL